MPSALFKSSSLSSAVINETNTTTIFHDFSWPIIIFHDFPSLENEILKFHYFFYDPPEPCAQKKHNKTKQNKQTNKIEINPTPPPSAS